MIHYLFAPNNAGYKKLLSGAALIGGILIIIGATLAYLNYFQSSEKIFQKMMTNVAEIKSFEYAGEMNLETYGESLFGEGQSLAQPMQQGENKKKSNFFITFAGSSDINDLENPSGTFSLKIDALPKGTFSLAFEMRNIDNVIYANLTDISPLGLLDLSFLRNQWFKIDNKMAQQQLGLENMDEESLSSGEKQELSPEQIEQLKAIIIDAEVLKVTKKLPGEKVEGMDMYHYQFVIDKEGIKKLITDVGDKFNMKSLTQDEFADIDKKLGAAESPQGEIWIGKKDLLPYKIYFNSIVNGTGMSENPAKMSLTLSLNNFNEPLRIDVPAGAKPIEEILQNLFSNLQMLLPETSQ